MRSDACADESAKISAQGALGALYRERWERWEHCIGSARERWGAFSALASVQERERSASSIGLPPTGKHCADLFEHELR